MEFISTWFDNRVRWINDELHTMSAVKDIVVEKSSAVTIDVYMLNGSLCVPNATPEQLKQLPKGVYIGNGQKFVIH